MKFDLFKPCDGCPFLLEGGVKFLVAERITDIAEGDGLFPCHKTTEMDEDLPPSKDERVCAGFVAYQLENGCGQMIRIMGRVGAINDKKYKRGCKGRTHLELDALTDAHER